MSQINKCIFAIILLFSLGIHAQNSISEDPETIINTVNHRIFQAQNDIENSNYYEAQNKLESALTLAKKIDNKKSIGLIHSKLGKLNHIMEEHKEAIKWLTKAIEIQRFAQDNLNLAETYKILGNVYMSSKEYQLAFDYFTSAKTLFEQEDLNNFVAEALLNQGLAQIALKNYRKSIAYFQRSIDMSRRYDLSKIQSSALINLGKTLSLLGEPEKALEQVISGTQIAENNNYGDVLANSYQVLSDINYDLENFKISNDYLKEHIRLSDSLLEAKRESLSPDKRMKFLVEAQTEYQKEKLADLEEYKSKEGLNRLTTILSIALITILSLLTLSLYKNNNIRLKTNNMLHKKTDELIIAKEKAELASKTKANFLSTVTHELRTPLYAVTGLSNMLLDEDPKPEQIKHLKSLKFSGDYLLTFINDILQINKIEANKVELEPEIFNLKKKITNVVAALNNSALDNNIKIHFKYDKELPNTFKGDQLKISQILINLIGNAIKFTKDGDIWIRVNKVSEEDRNFNVRFEIEDNGIGISKEKQEQMFESFSQGSIQINRKYGGTGLGLSIVKGLIELLKGNISVQSELGKGTTFFFEIPLIYTEQKETIQKKVNYFANVEKSKLENVKILVVEDNKINQMITKKILTKMNLNCEVVDNGEEAINLVKTNNYDVVLMDIHMPGISGMEATKLIRTFDKDLTIFALTAVTIEDKMHEFDEAGFTDIISKPFKQEDFERKLYGALIGEKPQSPAVSA